ncbi:hypothetical protein PJ985_16380 [Streptomyces sp. ACA25]|nr:hypothetical protein [Streptomyces sp. ACA25]MDB1089140.1 hypothetical protein [Streptomyces sp. ACA25]
MDDQRPGRLLAVSDLPVSHAENRSFVVRDGLLFTAIVLPVRSSREENT